MHPLHGIERLVSEMRKTVEREGNADRIGSMLEQAADEIERLRGVVERARILLPLITVRMVIEAGDEETNAAGLNPWCINEGRATGKEPISTWWCD